jgi:putative oxidoreductase
MRPLAVVRIAVGLLLDVHGWTRVLSGGVPRFGEWLAGQGFPAGTALAWAISIFEIVGSFCLVIGRFVRFVAPVHIAILGAGIAMVHAREGWFVVGGGRNGVEYSVLLIACLSALTWDAWRRRGRAPRNGDPNRA